jgi:hypothetical protein
MTGAFTEKRATVTISWGRDSVSVWGRGQSVVLRLSADPPTVAVTEDGGKRYMLRRLTSDEVTAVLNAFATSTCSRA